MPILPLQGKGELSGESLPEASTPVESHFPRLSGAGKQGGHSTNGKAKCPPNSPGLCMLIPKYGNVLGENMCVYEGDRQTDTGTQEPSLLLLSQDQ